MKPHLLIKTGLGSSLYKYPFWGDVVTERNNIPRSLHDSIDDVFRNYGIEFIVTSEYPHQANQWNKEEVESGLNQVYRIILKENKKIPEQLVKEIQLIPGVHYVKIGEIASVPLPEQKMSSAMAAAAYDVARKAIGLDRVSSYSKGLPQIKIAVLDTGIDIKHPELRHCLVDGFDFVDIINGAEDFIGDYLDFDPDPEDEVGHGTHVAGIIAARGLKMSPGVVPECKIIPVKVLGAMKKGESRVGAGLHDNISTGIKWAVDQGADIINMSLGVRHVGGGLPHEEVVEYARRKGVTIVAATGNDGSEELYYPGALPYVIAVGAMDDSIMEVAAFSTFGRQVDFVAPGSQIYSTYVGGKYAFSSGTSHAAPFVTGAAALLKSLALQEGIRIRDKHIKYLLKHSSDKIGTKFKEIRAGYGMINLIDAIKLLKYKILTV